jgi:hypothetical protein
MGYSRGGAAVQSVLAYVSSIRPEITVDLVITVGPVNIGQAGGSAVGQKQANVRTHVNFVSEQAHAAIPRDEDEEEVWPSKIPWPSVHEHIVAGARNILVPGTSHFSIMEESMRTWKRIEHPAPPGPGGRPSIEYVYQGEQDSPVWRLIDSLMRKEAFS